MSRKLPSDPQKRRLQVFKRLYQSREHWHALMEDRGMSDVITDEETGEDIFLGDLMVGIDTLPTRQRQAFELICLQGFTETAARDELLPNSRSSTPVQQYSNSGLVRMVDAYDLKQQGRWPPSVESPPPKRSKIKTKERTFVMAATLHPITRKHLEAARADYLTQIEALQSAMAHVDELLGLGQTPAVQRPAPNPKPEGKPDLDQMAKELAATG
jgi:hypothetical protein